MRLENFTPISALIGGALIGLSATMMLLLNGRVAGISGILDGIVNVSGKEWTLRALFLVGLLLGGGILLQIYPAAFGGEIDIGLPWLLSAGVLVGFGTRLGSGCTSGHGVCGLSRLSTRSLVATMGFMAIGFLAASILHGVLWVQP